MSGGVNRLIEQRKAAELSAYEIAKEERADKRQLDRDERGVQANIDGVKLAARFSDERDLGASVQARMQNIVNAATSIKKITQKFNVLTETYEPMEEITEASLSKEAAIESLEALMKSLEGNKAVYKKANIFYDAYLKQLNSIITSPSGNVITKNFIPSPKITDAGTGRFARPVPTPVDQNRPLASAGTRSSMPDIKVVTPPNLN